MNFIVLFTLFSNYILIVNSDISDKRLCGDPTCSEPISEVVSLVTYPSSEANILSFQKNVVMKIYSKSAGSRIDLWGAEYKGKRGYVPYRFVRETKLYKNKLDYLVPTEGHENEDQNNISADPIKHEPSFDSFITSVPSDGVSTDIPSPTKVSEPYEVVEGTTIAILPDNNQKIVAETTFTTSKPNTISQEKQNQNDKSLKFNSVENFQNFSELVKANVTEINSEQKENINNNDSTFVDKENNHSILFTESNTDNEVGDQLIHEFISSNEQKSKNELNKDIDVDNEENIEEMEVEVEDGEDDDDDDDEDDEFVLSEELEDINSSENVNVNKNINLETVNNVNSNENHNMDSINNIKTNDLNNSTSDSIIYDESNPLESYESIVTSTEKSIENEQLNDASSDHKDNNKNEEQFSTLENIEKVEIIDEIDTNSQNNQDNMYNVLNFEERVENNVVKSNLLESKFNENKLSFDNNVDVTKEPLITTETVVETKSNSVEKSLHIPLPINNIKENNIKSEESLGVDFSQSLDSTNEFTTLSVDTEKNFQENKLLLENEKSNIIYSQEFFENKLKDNPTVIEDTNVIEDTTVIEDQNINPFTEEMTTVHADYSQNLINQEASDFDNIELFESNRKEQIESVTSNIVSAEDNPEIEDMLNKDEIEQFTDSPGFFDKFFNFFQSSVEESTVDKHSINEILHDAKKVEFFENNRELQHENIPKDSDHCQMCTVSSSQCPEYNGDHLPIGSQPIMDFPASSYDTFVYLAVTGITVLLFTLGYYYIEKMRQDGTLIGKINELEKALLISSKECIILKEDLQKTQEKLIHVTDTSFGSNETLHVLKIELEESNSVRSELEEKVSSLEKELDNATEAGLELNRMLSDLLTSQNGSDNLVQSVEKLQTQLNEQQNVITDMNTTLGSKNNETELLQSEVSIANEKIINLQLEVDKLVGNLVTFQEEKVSNEQDFENRLKEIQVQLDTVNQMKIKEVNELTDELKKIQTNLKNTERLLEVKEKELSILHDSMKSNQGENSDFQNLFEISHLKAEFDQCMKDRDVLFEKCHSLESTYKLQEESAKETTNLMNKLKSSLDEAEKEKIEAQMRLEVLSSYFKEREVQLQKDLARHEELWLHNQGEANSTVERMKVLQEEFQNYKSQNEMLKKEIVDQEVSLKSQISVLEKKVHENWLIARQAERRLEESKQECAQLRNRLTVVEKNLTNSSQLTDEAKSQYRVLSPLNTNGDLHGSPLHIPGVESSASPPLLFPPREHMTTSPPLPFMGLPPPPPPPGVPFLPPPPGVPFMPPPPSLYPGDRRPPPLGRMSSPPPSTFSPNRTFSPYDRDNSPSRFPSTRQYGSLDPPFRDMDNYRHMSPPPVNQYEIHPDTNNDWDDPHRTIGHRSRSGRQKKGALKNDI